MLYNEPYRPQYHFSAPQNWLNDPNGLVYYEGEYHLFYQHNPNDIVWGPMYWGHAVSKDLVHWENLPIALEPDELGTIFSGCCIVDKDDTSGFFDGGSGLIAYYTAHLDRGEKHCIETQCIAYSKDKGRTWIKYSGNPIITPPGTPDDYDFRDPKVVWDEENNQWLMALGGGFIRFYRSTDLINWEFMSQSLIFEEFPDIFKLEVENEPGNRKWVLALAGFRYYIGRFEEGRFIIEQSVLSGDYAVGCQAAQTYSNMPDGRTVWIAWMRDGSRGPTDPWRCCMTVPKELSLRRMADGTIRLIQKPVAELEQLRSPLMHIENKAFAPNENILAGLAGKELDMEAEISGLTGARQLELKLFVGEDQQTLIRVDFESGHVFADYTGAHIPALRDKQTAFENNYYTVPERVKLRGYCYNAPFTPGDKIRFRVLCDRSTVEFFIPDTDVEFSFCVYPTQDADAVSLCCNTGCTVDKIDVYRMESVWR